MATIEGEVSVGCPPTPSSLGLSGEEWQSFKFHFHDFADLDTTKDEYITSPKFSCNGHKWQLEVYPGGEGDAAEGKVSVYITLLSGKTEITVTIQVDIMDKFGKKSKRGLNENEELETGDSWGRENFISYLDIVDESKNILDSDGTLTIVVSLKEESTTAFVPENPLLEMMKEMFNDETTSDVCFEVISCAKKKKGVRKRSKESVSFHAHRSIVRKCAPMLADLLGAKDTATVTDIKTEIFSHLLYFVYGGKIAEKDLEAHAKDIIDAADKYSIINLKLAAEAAYVQSTDITFDNAIDDLLYADSKNCALLKEKVMQFLADNHLEASGKISFSDFPGDLVKDLLVAFATRRSRFYSDDHVDELDTLSVTALRRKLHRLGLEVDGSREAMIEAIKSHYSAM